MGSQSDQASRAPIGTCVRPRSMAPWTTARTTSRRSHGDDARLPLHKDLDRRGEPAHLPAQPARAAGGVLRRAGGLADRRPRARPGKRHQARPARPAGSARSRALGRDRPAARLSRRPALPEGAAARPARRGTRHAQRRAPLGHRAFRYRLGGGSDDAADARGVSPSSSMPPSSTASPPASNGAPRKAAGRPDGSRSVTAATSTSTSSPTSGPPRS
jgi:hypothetical protein